MDGCLSSDQYLDVIDSDSDDKDEDGDDDDEDGDDKDEDGDVNYFQVMAHCWARQPRARPSFPHLAGS